MSGLMVLPQCGQEGHGQMEIRTLGRQSKEQQWCGTWYDCKTSGCSCSALLPSRELTTFLAQETAKRREAHAR
jgi:hypothetical protein